MGVSDATANIVVNEERKRESPFRYHQALEFEGSEPKRKECVCVQCSQRKRRKGWAEVRRRRLPGVARERVRVREIESGKCNTLHFTTTRVFGNHNHMK